MERKPLYHLSPSSAREAILREGLTIGNPPHFDHLSPAEHPDGVIFFWTNFTMASRGRGRYTFDTDLWVVEGDGLTTQADPSGGLVADPGCCTAEPVPASRLRLIGCNNLSAAPAATVSLIAPLAA